MRTICCSACDGEGSVTKTSAGDTPCRACDGKGTVQITTTERIFL